jgi:hypothetical protein
MASPERRRIIADVQRLGTAARLPWAIFIGASLVGLAAALHFAGIGLTLSHHDARAHLVVARRIIDNLTPGWQQVGALWLPLPHVLNMVPVQWDWNYRTGASAVVMSVAALAWGLASFGRYVVRRTHSPAAAVASVAIILLNPNVLYLQSTPMTEPLLFGLGLVAIDAVDRWLDRAPGSSSLAAGWLLALFVLTRYEAWPVTVALLLIAATAGVRRVDLARLASGPALAIAGFFVLSKATVGAWFISSGFFVADNPAVGRPLVALREIVRGFLTLTDWPLVAMAALGLLWCGRAAIRARSGRPLLPVALLAAAILPLGAFANGHPLRVRYMTSILIGTGVLSAFGIASLPARWRAAAAVGLVAGCVYLNPPLSLSSPVLLEAGTEGPMRAGRAAISAVLANRSDRSPILASMQSLAHYMQETSAFGLNVADFLNEGNGDLWTAAVADPERYVRWVLIEERAEGGDVLADRARSSPAFLQGFTRVAEGGGAALYRRDW